MLRTCGRKKVLSTIYNIIIKNYFQHLFRTVPYNFVKASSSSAELRATRRFCPAADWISLATTFGIPCGSIAHVTRSRRHNAGKACFRRTGRPTFRRSNYHSVSGTAGNDQTESYADGRSGREVWVIGRIAVLLQQHHLWRPRLTDWYRLTDILQRPRVHQLGLN